MSWTTYTHLHTTLLGLLLAHLSQPITAQQSPPWAQSNQTYNSPMATALIVMIVVFFSVGFISVYLRHFLACLGLRPYGIPLHGGVGGGARWSTEAPRGLDPNILNTFPTFLYSDVKIHRVGKTTPLECAICLNEFDDNEVLRLLPKCSHVFHPHCIGTWLSSHVTCPVCRTNLEIQLHNTTNELTNNSCTEVTDESEPSDQISRRDDHDHQGDLIVRLEIASPETREMIKGLSESGRMRLQRSHSTGHSLLENNNNNNNSDRFTLKLPIEVRNKLVNDNNFLSGLPAAIVSPRVGYRAQSMMSDRNNKWRFSMSPSFISRPSSPMFEGCIGGNSKNNNGSMGILMSPMSLFKSMKSPKMPLNNNFVKGSDIGERSSDKLWADRGAQEVELENH